MTKSQIKHNQSKSLWNYTLSPGWTPDEVEVLKKALQKFGIGQWKKIIDAECLPKKSIGQIYLQTQRLMGQQSLGDFMRLHIDIERVFIDNSKKTNVVRKNKCIVNTGDNPNQEERKRKIEENRTKYGLDLSEVKKIKLPKKNRSRFKNVIMLEEILSDKFSTVEKLNYLEELMRLTEYKLELIEKLPQGYFKDSDINRSKFASYGVGSVKRIKKKGKRRGSAKYYDYSSDEEGSMASQEYNSICALNLEMLAKIRGPLVTVNLRKENKGYQFDSVVCE